MRAFYSIPLKQFIGLGGDITKLNGGKYQIMANGIQVASIRRYEHNDITFLCESLTEPFATDISYISVCVPMVLDKSVKLPDNESTYNKWC